MLGSPIVVRAFSNKYFYLKEKTVRAQYVTSYNILAILLLFQKVARFFSHVVCIKGILTCVEEI